ncbi:MAG TPA: ATP-dependent Clp protease proteolytic subunit [Flavobacteriales bacterium]|mgnify:CR=1 FL=1|jgi:ATP-dependent Clp protease, protease subunit|nr:ATP-dependent Clp protease proteolytic subunit [Flavobacteriales bacterium]HAW18979.1 ATP-dependent Clp protease proteolytic subunit [Flavobacteriales bacterium]
MERLTRLGKEEKDEKDDKKEKGFDQGLINKKFLENRQVFLWGGVDDDSAKHVIDRLMYLEADKPGEEITFFINSPGGYVTSGMAIYDVMQMISSPVNAVCMGLAASMGSILLSGGQKGKREIFKHGRVMIHQPSLGGFQGTASDIEIQTNEIIKTKELSAHILADNCGQTFAKVMKDFNRDHWLNAEEAVKYGIVDSIR